MCNLETLLPGNPVACWLVTLLILWFLKMQPLDSLSLKTWVYQFLAKDWPYFWRYEEKTANLATLLSSLATLLVPCFWKCEHSIPHPRKYGYTDFGLNTGHIFEEIKRKLLIWQPCYRIWQPCSSAIFENATIRFIVLKNLCTQFLSSIPALS